MAAGYNKTTMGKALYRKYRSKKLSEIVGQQHITTSLSNALQSGKIGHAYLFTGPRGTGKTSIARILAHEVNKLPYEDDTNHLDIIEIDAASNRRIDEIRTLRDRVHNAPTMAKYKVYIIDEVHMLTKEAFNALLKTLEEPPKHVIFILATTEAHKLPETIISRTQRFSFKPASLKEVASHLSKIAKQEKISITDEALELIAKHGGGSLRDSISMLDQVSNSRDKVDADSVQQMLGIAPQAVIDELIKAAESAKAAEIVNLLSELQEQGLQPPNIARQLADKFRDKLLNSADTSSADKTLKLLERLIEVPASHDPQSLLEIVLIDYALAAQPTTKPNIVSVKKPENNQTYKPADIEKTVETEAEAETSSKDQSSNYQPKQQNIPKEPTKQPTDNSGPLDENSWQTVLLALKQKHNTLYGIARMASPLFETDKLTLSFNFPFHQKKLNDARNKKILSEIILSETGLSPEIVCVVDAAKQSEDQPAAGKSDAQSPIDTISNIFGGAEVLE